MKEVNNNAETLKKNFLELTELKHILQKTQTFFDEVSMRLLSRVRHAFDGRTALNLLIWGLLLNEFQCVRCKNVQYSVNIQRDAF